MIALSNYRWSLVVLVLSAWLCSSVDSGLADEGQYRKRVEVQASTRLDWTFAATRRSLVDPPASLVGDDYDSTHQAYEFYRPDSKSAVQQGLPLILYVSRKDQADGWHPWEDVCRQHGFCFAGPHDAGAEQALPRRIRTILDILDDVRRRVTIDPDRTYLVGRGEGAHMACELGYSLPECFGGVIAIGGGEPPPVPRWMQRRIAERLSVAFVSVERGKAATFIDAYFHPMAVAIGAESKHWQRYHGKAKSPSSGLLEEALLWADQGAFRRRELAAKFPSTRLSEEEPRKREEQANAVFAEAKQRLADESSLDAGLRELEGLQKRWPDLPVAASAESLRLEFAAKDQRPWSDRREEMRDRLIPLMFALEHLHWKYLGIKSDVQFRDRSLGSEFPKQIVGGKRKRPRGRPRLLRNYIEDSMTLKWEKSPAEQEATLNDSARFERANVEIARRMGGMIAFDRRGRVEQLHLCGTKVTAKQLRSVKKQLHGLQDLRVLDLSSALMPESALREIADLRELRALSLNHVEVSDRGLSALADFDQLQFLGLAFTDVASLRHLRSVGELRWLFLGGSQAEDKSLKKLAKATNLRQLSLFLCPITDAGIAHLVRLPKLRSLNVALTKVGDTGCKSLAQILTLEELVLDETLVTDDGLKILAGLSNLRHLSLEGLHVTDEGLRTLAAMKNLESLNVAKTQVTAGGIRKFRSLLPECKVQWNGDLTDYRALQRVQRAHDALLEKESEVRRFSLRAMQRRLLGVCLCSGEGLGVE